MDFIKSGQEANSSVLCGQVDFIKSGQEPNNSVLCRQVALEQRCVIIPVVGASLPWFLLIGDAFNTGFTV